MFHVEHMSKLMVFISFFLILGCERPETEPEKFDPIYSDLLKQSAEVKTQIATAEKELEGFKAEFEAVEPQTGKIKYATKRVNETRAKLDKLIQMQFYWDLKAKSRVRWDRENYLVAFKSKAPWPPPEEYKTYLAQKKLETAPKVWNLRERLDQAKLGISLNGPKETEREEKEKREEK